MRQSDEKSFNNLINIQLLFVFCNNWYSLGAKGTNNVGVFLDNSQNTVIVAVTTASSSSSNFSTNWSKWALNASGYFKKILYIVNTAFLRTYGFECFNNLTISSVMS
ncbi:hypothetical protein WICPIJ_002638 [Wickerhamomyces pijperi]|uniref:Uncharacterized protein n=1 Tax=Wickerhamomyces pijperi TaxID=599730 RepID=A0A9P8QB38_WICPI|nr:hypothetical protein WICPIJ_002638 [Wickerhamomyces pijperi]